MTGFLFLLALTSLAGSPLLVRFAQAPIEFLGFWRLITAGLLLLAWQLAHGKARLWQKPHWSRWRWTVIAACFFFLHLWTYMAAVRSTSIAHMTILFATNPLFTVAGAGLFFREKLQRRLLIAYPLALLGLWILMQEKVSAAPESASGDLLAILAAVLHAAYLLSSKRARLSMDNLSFSAGLYLGTGMLFGLTGLVRGTPWQVPQWQAWAGVAGLILFPTFLGHALMTYLVNRMNVGLLSCGKLLEPGISSVLAAILFHEELTRNEFVAFALAATSVVLLFWPTKWSLRVGKSV